MKIISLNTWGGRAGKESLLSFFQENKDVDVFCLQEVWSGGESLDLVALGLDDDFYIAYRLLNDIEKVLTGHYYHFRPHVADHYGLAIFINKDLEILEEGEIYVYQDKGFYEEGNIGNHARNIQYVTLGGDNPVTIINFHGLWNGKGKTDTPDRLLQSTNIINFIKTLGTPYVLVGDFNLRPDTESVKRIEDTGAINLISKYKITSTRTSFYSKPEKFADYAFISPNLKEKSFKVLPDEVSDHAPLFVEV